MPIETQCAQVRARLEEAFLARRAASDADLAHLEGCAGCAAEQRALGALAEALDALPTPEVRPSVLARARRAAAAELAGLTAPARAPLPLGFGRELARLLASAAAGLPVVLLWNWAVLRFGGELLTGLVPAPLLAPLGVAYALAAAGWLAVVFGAIPFVAHGRSRRLQEVLS